MRLDQGQIEVVDDLMPNILRRKKPAERIGIGFSLWTSAQRMVFAHLKSAHPELSIEELNREVAGRLSHEAL